MIKQPNQPFVYAGGVIAILSNKPTTLLRYLTFPHRLVHVRLNLCLALLLILLATLIPNYRNRKDQAYRLQVVPLTQEVNRLARVDQPIQALKTRRFFADSVNNLILFAPLGIALNTLLGQRRIRRRRRFWLVLGFAMLLSLTVETLQFWYASRMSDIDDVIINSLGALLGAMAATQVHSSLVSHVFRQKFPF